MLSGKAALFDMLDTLRMRLAFRSQDKPLKIAESVDLLQPEDVLLRQSAALAFFRPLLSAPDPDDLRGIRGTQRGFHITQPGDPAAADVIATRLFQNSRRMRNIDFGPEGGLVSKLFRTRQRMRPADPLAIVYQSGKHFA